MTLRRDRTITLALAIAALVVVALAMSRSSRRAAGEAADPRRYTTTTSTTAGADIAVKGASTTRADGGRLDTLVLTQDRLDNYQVSATTTALRFRANAHDSGRNLRMIAWDPDVDASVDEEVCATWREQTDHHSQFGLSLRTRQDGTRWRTITVSKNVLFAAYSNVNVHTWDTDRTTTIATAGSVHVAGLIRTGMEVWPLPWRMCARALGDQVQVKVWPTRGPEPSWSDPRYAGSVTLPPGWVLRGRPGWYAGHLPTAGTAAATGIEARSLDPTP